MKSGTVIDDKPNYKWCIEHCIEIYKCDWFGTWLQQTFCTKIDQYHIY